MPLGFHLLSVCFFFWNNLIVQSDQRLRAAKKDLTPLLSVSHSTKPGDESQSGCLSVCRPHGTEALLQSNNRTRHILMGKRGLHESPSKPCERIYLNTNTHGQGKKSNEIFYSQKHLNAQTTGNSYSMHIHVCTSSYMYTKTEAQC